MASAATSPGRSQIWSPSYTTPKTRSMKYVSGSTVGDRLEELRERVALEERAGEEEHREVDRVHDRRRALGPLDETGQPDAERGEGRGAEDQRQHEREEVARERRAEGGHPDATMTTAWTRNAIIVVVSTAVR